VIVDIPISFEEMRWQDVPSVIEIEYRSFTLPWSANTYRHEILENANAHYYVLRRHAEAAQPRGWLQRLARRESNSTLIGYGGFWMIVDEAHISTIAVDVGWRGRGLGEFLLASMIERAARMNIAKITLEVRESNLVAQALYRKYGFAITGKRPHYYQDNQENAFIMGVMGVNTEAYRNTLGELTLALSARLTMSRESLAG